MMEVGLLTRVHIDDDDRDSGRNYCTTSRLIIKFCLDASFSSGMDSLEANSSMSLSQSWRKSEVIVT